MQDKINPNIRSIIHILNNWNFTYDGSHVRTNLEIYITEEELQSLIENFNNEIKTLQQMQDTDEEIRSYQTAIADLEFCINELKKSRV